MKTIIIVALVALLNTAVVRSSVTNDTAILWTNTTSENSDDSIPIEPSQDCNTTLLLEFCKSENGTYPGDACTCLPCSTTCDPEFEQNNLQTCTLMRSLGFCLKSTSGPPASASASASASMIGVSSSTHAPPPISPWLIVGVIIALLLGISFLVLLVLVFTCKKLQKRLLQLIRNAWRKLQQPNTTKDAERGEENPPTDGLLMPPANSAGSTVDNRVNLVPLKRLTQKGEEQGTDFYDPFEYAKFHKNAKQEVIKLLNERPSLIHTVSQ